MHGPVSAAEMSGVRQLAHPSCLVVVAEMGVKEIWKTQDEYRNKTEEQ